MWVVQYCHGPSIYHPWYPKTFLWTFPCTICQSYSLYSGHPWIIQGRQPSPHTVSEYLWMPHMYMYLGYPWIIHGRPTFPAPCVRVSMDAAYTQAIHGRPTFPPPCVRVSMDVAYTQAIHGSSMDVQPSPPPFARVFNGCRIYSGHPWIIDGRPTFPAPCVRVSMDAIYTQAIMDHPWTSNLPHTLCQSIYGCCIYSGHTWIIHGCPTFPALCVRVSLVYHQWLNGCTIFPIKVWMPTKYMYTFINPRRTCAARVTAVILCVCLSVTLILANQATVRSTNGSSAFS